MYCKVFIILKLIKSFVQRLTLSMRIWTVYSTKISTKCHCPQTQILKTVKSGVMVILAAMALLYIISMLTLKMYAARMIFFIMGVELHS